MSFKYFWYSIFIYECNKKEREVNYDVDVGVNYGVV